MHSRHTSCTHTSMQMVCCRPHKHSQISQNHSTAVGEALVHHSTTLHTRTASVDISQTKNNSQTKPPRPTQTSPGWWHKEGDESGGQQDPAQELGGAVQLKSKHRNPADQDQDQDHHHHNSTTSTSDFVVSLIKPSHDFIILSKQKHVLLYEMISQ